MIEAIINDLGSNFNPDDRTVLGQLIEDVSQVAESFANNDRENMSYEIKQTVKSIYLQRGAEDVSGRSESGVSSTYIDAMDRMRNMIISAGKRRVF